MVDFPFIFSSRVGVADINYGGHVSNAAVLTFFQDARMAYLASLGPYTEMDVGGCGLIMAEAHVYYRQEMFHGDSLRTGVRVAALKRSGFVLQYRIESRSGVTAEGTTPLVCYDYDKRKACRIPPAFRQILEQQAGAPPGK
jgi:acyl-CoA thioester hydrolase